MITLNATSVSTTMPVGTSLNTKLTTLTMISMMFIGFSSCARATAQMLGGGSVGSALVLFTHIGST